jgi:hypothetical protein
MFRICANEGHIVSMRVAGLVVAETKASAIWVGPGANSDGIFIPPGFPDRMRPMLALHQLKSKIFSSTEKVQSFVTISVHAELSDAEKGLHAGAATLKKMIEAEKRPSSLIIAKFAETIFLYITKVPQQFDKTIVPLIIPSLPDAADVTTFAQ